MNLHSKAAELRNSIFHLHSSNQQLQIFADEGDQECAVALQDNHVTLGRMEERIAALRNEVEIRGFIWPEDLALGRDSALEANEDGDETVRARPNVTENESERRMDGCPLTDELATRLLAHVNEHTHQEEPGVHL